MARRDVPLESWEAVVPGVVLPAVALWLGGTTWGDRAVAAAANLAPLAVLALLAWWGGARLPAVQGAATVAYGVVALGWVGASWEVPGLETLGAHAASWTPLAGAGLAGVVYLGVAAALRFTGGGPVTGEV